MFSDRIKDFTKLPHAALEKKMVQQIKAISTTTAYTEFLSLMYGFYAPLEKAIAPFAAAIDPAGDYDARKSDAALADIHFFDVGASLPVTAVSLPALHDANAALGALYVLEGSALGGKFIAGMISKQLHLPLHNGFSFFNSGGDDVQARWAAFKNLLNKPRTETEQATILSAAGKTFEAFGAWFEVVRTNAAQAA